MTAARYRAIAKVAGIAGLVFGVGGVVSCGFSVNDNLGAAMLGMLLGAMAMVSGVVWVVCRGVYRRARREQRDQPKSLGFAVVMEKDE